MNKAITASIIALTCSPATTFAQGFEFSILGGWTAPTFEEQFILDVDIDLPDIPGGNLRQQGDFSLTGRGSFAFGGSIAYFFNEHIGIEGRIDTVNFEIDTEGPRFGAEIDLSPFPPGAAILDVGMGSVNVERLLPLSFNVKARTGGRTRFVASGGVSYLPRISFEAVQPVGLGIDLPGLPPTELAAVVLRAGALTDTEDSRWGFNGGAGLEIQVAPRVAIVGDVRVHRFESQTFVWQRSDNPSSPLEGALIALLEDLPPIEVELIYFQLTGGIAFRF